MHAFLFQTINYSVVFSLLNSKKAVRIQLFTDGASIVLRKHYYTGLNHINMVFRQHVLNITTLTIISNFSVLIFLNFNLIPSVRDLSFDFSQPIRSGSETDRQADRVTRDSMKVLTP